MGTKHLTLSERIKIEYHLNGQKDLSEIAQIIGRDRATVGREIKRHMVERRTGSRFGDKFNDCQNRYHCHAEGNCELDNGCTRKNCRNCKHGCGQGKCASYIRETCNYLFHAPYVCNGCHRLDRCTLKKYFYEAHKADKEYHDDLSEFRNGLAIDNGEKEVIAQILRDGMIGGQSLYSIMSCHQEEIPYSVSTMYSYVNSGVFEGIGSLNMPRKPRFKKRKAYKRTREESDKHRQKMAGRRKEDFDIFMEMNPEACVLQLDSVLAPKGETRCILTILFVDSSLQLAFLRENNDAASVVKALDKLRIKFGPLDYHRLFEVLLADNGSEFSDPEGMEFDFDTADRVSMVFYCHPMASWEKGKCENNHTLIRRVIPKGYSFKDLTQEKVSLMMNHINSYPRRQFDGKSAYDIFVLKHGKDVADKLGLTRIEPEKVVLRPNLLN